MNALNSQLLSDRLTPVGQIVIRHYLNNPKDSVSRHPSRLRLTTSNLTTGMLVELLVCLDRLGFVLEETDERG